MKSSHFGLTSLLLMVLSLPGLAQQTVDGPTLDPSFGNGLRSEPLYAHWSGPGSWDFGVQTRLRAASPLGLMSSYGLSEPSGAGSSSGLFLGYRLSPGGLSVQGALRTSTDWSGRGVALDMGVHGNFNLTDNLHLRLGISASWMNDHAGQQLLGEIGGGSAQYALDAPNSALRDMRAGVALNGNWSHRWSYALGANLGRYFGDPRTGAGLGLVNLNGMNGLNGSLFMRTRFEF